MRRIVTQNPFDVSIYDGSGVYEVEVNGVKSVYLVNISQAWIIQLDNGTEQGRIQAIEILKDEFKTLETPTEAGVDELHKALAIVAHKEVANKILSK